MDPHGKGMPPMGYAPPPVPARPPMSAPSPWQDTPASHMEPLHSAKGKGGYGAWTEPAPPAFPSKGKLFTFTEEPFAAEPDFPVVDAIVGQSHRNINHILQEAVHLHGGDLRGGAGLSGGGRDRRPEPSQ